MSELSEYLEIKEGVCKEEFSDYNFASPFEWDNFQKHAFLSIQRGDNVLVTAPTSSGKTKVAEYAMEWNLRQNKRVVYTSPIKSLSNEKWGEFKEKLSERGIVPGLLTGDNKINTDSKFIIVTAEILRNSLFQLKDDHRDNNDEKDSRFEINRDFVKSIGCVIMDEVHFINDKDRGHVWEETIILLKREIQLIMLSATIDRPEEFASWIGEIHQKKISLIKKYDRPIPIDHNIFDGTRCHIFANSGGEYNSNNFMLAKKEYEYNENLMAAKHSNKIYGMLNSVVSYLQKNDMMQAIFFTFSKKNCERFANSVNVELVDKKESATIAKILDLKMGIFLKDYDCLPRYAQIREMICRGVCYHHSGLPVILKEIVEIMFKEGYIKILFPTETFSVGVNMPVRTVVFTSLIKNTTDGKRHLNAAEFNQMCGRAGRRGVDKKGSVVILPLYEFPDEHILKNRMLFGNMPRISSNMEITYQSYLKLHQSEVTSKDSFLESSLLCREHQQLKNVMCKEYKNSKINYDSERKRILSKHRITPYMASRFDKYMEYTNPVRQNMWGYAVKLSKKNKKDKKDLARFVSSNLESYKEYEKLGGIKKKINQCNSMIKYYKNFKNSRFALIIEFLKEYEYIDKNMIPTQYGVIASQINECNCFLLTEMITEGLFHSLTPEEIVPLVSIFTSPVRSHKKIERNIDAIDVPPSVIDRINYMVDVAEKYRNMEKNLLAKYDEKYISPYDYWDISIDYVHVSYMWAKNTPMPKILGILEEMQEYEGQFVKNMLKINNIIANVISMCKMINMLDIVPMLEKVQAIIIRDIVNVNSLYIIK